MRAFVVFLLALIFAAAFATEMSSPLQEIVDQQIIQDHGQASMEFFSARNAEIMAENSQLSVSGVYGVDFSTAFSTSTLSCIKGKGHTYVIPRGYRSSGTLDPNIVSNVKNAWAAGFKYVDAYLFPCFSCGNGSGQVQALYNKLKSNGAKVGMIWLDVEGTKYWGSQANNRAFFESMLKGAAAVGAKIGVYTSKSQWDPIMGSYSGGKNYPLWYARYDNKPNFSDFVSFGGWSKPAMKQYVGDTTLCGGGVDLNVW